MTHLGGLVYIQFSSMNVGKEYGIIDRRKFRSSLLGAGSLFFHSVTLLVPLLSDRQMPWQLELLERFFLSILRTPN
jgi:hypothetical protein